MKEIFLRYSINKINSKNNYDEERLAELKYGLETFYMLITKMSVYIILAIFFNLLKELLIFLAFYIPLRGVGFGFHANNSKQCWIITGFIFIIFPYLAKILNLNMLFIQIFILLCCIIFLFFAPADSKKKPLINQRKRLLNKSLIVIISLIYLFITLFINNDLILNSIMFACIWQAICVSPLTYKLFNQSFNNYKNFIIKV